MVVLDFNYKKMKMDISKLLNKILSEQSTTSQTAKGINYKDTYEVLTKAKECPNLTSLGDINQMTQSFPKIGEIPLINKFKEIYEMKPDAIAYATANIGGQKVIVFGVVDPNTQSGKRGLYAYTLIEGQSPVRRSGGAGTGCPTLQKFEDYGQSVLSEYDQSILDGVLKRCGNVYTVADKSNMANFKRIKMKDITDCVTGESLPWEKVPEGYVWKQVAAGDIRFSNIPEEISKIMKAQGFTSNQNEVTSPELLELGFYLKDVKNDNAFSRIDPNVVGNIPYWPIKGGTIESKGILIDPTPNECRDLVKLLKACRTKDKNVTLSQCRTNLTQRKLSTIRCDRKNIFKSGGMLGLKDDFTSLLSDSGDYGLAKLYANIGTVVKKESTLELKINKLLNEEHSKFSFNPTNEPQYQFDKVIIEELANQLVVSALFDVQKSLSKTKRLNENMFGDIAGSLSSNWMDKLVGGGKEYLASKVISMLGFDPTSYTALVFKNIFANLDFNQYDDFLSNCPKFTNVIVKSALEAWLDLAASKVMGKDKISSVVYMALKNMVTETAANTSTYKRLEKVAGNLVCPLVSGISDSIKSGDINPFN